MEITAYADKIFTELTRLTLMLFGVVTDDSSHNKRISENYQQRNESLRSHVREEMKKTLPPGSNPDDFVTFTGPDPTAVNAEYSAYLNQSLGEMVLCRSVDCYHWYLRQVVLLILGANPALLRPWANKLGITTTDQLDAFENGLGREKLLTDWFRGREWRTRQLVHEHWNMPLKEDLGVLVKVRNCIIHQLGEDTDGIRR